MNLKRYMSLNYKMMSENKIECKGNEELNFPKFNTIKVSTKTFIVMTNMFIDIDELFKILPITSYIVIPKRRGRKKKNEQVNPNKNIASGSIITLEYGDLLRGVDLKKKKDKKKGSEKKYFRNSATVVMIIEDKKVNFKVTRNGKFQITGCKFDRHSESCVKYIWNYIKDSTNIYTFIDEETYLKTLYIPAMRNIDFNLNFLIDREKLDEYFNNHTDYHSLLETSFGYTGVNIKIPLKKPMAELRIKQIDYKDGKWQKHTHIGYNDYLDLLPEKEKIKKNRKQRYNTFLVFHSGKVIMSGMEATFMEHVYYEFLDIVRKCYHIIEEKLDE